MLMTVIPRCLLARVELMLKKMTIKVPLMLAGLLLPLSLSAQQATTDDVIDAGSKRIQANKVAQQQVSSVLEQEKQLEQAYLQELKLKESVDIYNLMLQKQLDAQQSQIDKLHTSIANASLIERQVMPLLLRMVEALSQLIKVDMPFLLTERTNRVSELSNLLTRPDLTLAEKTRRVFEAYQIEMEYGYTIEAYQQELTVDGQAIAADVLRIGRVALLYQDVQGKLVGHYDIRARQWQALTDKQYTRHVDKGLRIAKEEIAPELITLPFNHAVEVR